MKFRTRRSRLRRPAGGARTPTLPAASSALIWLFIFAAAWAVYEYLPGSPLRLPRVDDATTTTVSFTLCGLARRNNCVVDGDTFTFAGQSIRIMDIDAPETHPPRCEFEAELGAQATARLRELLNEGPFALRRQGHDEDQYGRKLRIVTRDGRSLGGILVSENLARRWTGRRHPWC